jgi:predicted PurR-regulated permease PerM
MVIVGSLNYIGLTLIGIKYALPLAVLAGLLEVVPNLGPTIAAIPAVLVGFSQSPFLGVSALAVAVLVQQLENNLIVPLVMKKAVGLNPIITLMAFIIGGKLAGVLGVLLSVPVVVVLKTFFLEFLNKK